ncbi:MAG: late competence development ComFB family protein [Arthrospira sp. SH-MAG29]|nr:late competence development ComFB family protein [Arthrospira sp. SH-MAG29]MBS0016353.1 late competence development ComFB family protein [Arthrospira sp. SH-MAG29]
MNTTNDNKPPKYQNVMEIWVDEEIDHQLKRLSENLLKYISRVEVATYALNRLPPLYASCQEGRNKQEQRAKTYRGKIQETVRQAIAAVQRDPIRLSTPLISPEEVQDEQTIRELIDLLPKQTDARNSAIKLLKDAIAPLASPQSRPTPTPPPARRTVAGRTVPSEPLLSHRDLIQEQLRIAQTVNCDPYESSGSGKTGDRSRRQSRQTTVSHREQIEEQLKLAKKNQL